MDCSNYLNINNPKSRQVLLETINSHSLIDVFRYFYPHTRRYTWRRKNPIKQARLDYFIVSSPFTDHISKCDIIASYRSDHSILNINIEISKFERGKGLWKLNCNLLKNAAYIDLINKTIHKVKLEYALPVYRNEYLETAPDLDIKFSIDEDVLLEMIMFKIRSTTIKFASANKKEEIKREQGLIKNIGDLEKNEENTPSTENIDKLKKELSNLRESKMKGHMIRSRLQWLHLGEKPSKFFCSLEHKHFLDKTIRKICLENGSVIIEQDKILNEVKEYYAKLFKNKDSELLNVNLSEILNDSQINKLTNIQALALEGPVTLAELGKALKHMKNNKTPGIDGFPAEFFKVFWCKLKILILRAFNLFYEKGKLSVTLRQSIINCIPKGDKPRQYLKNWRPISLLTVLYKLLSSVLANRIKAVLDFLISRSQCGFIQGCYIGEATRLIYDVMNYTENKQIDGLLMLIDFEKAFDSISWNFLYNVLEYLGFGKAFIRWIRILNNDIYASVLQSGIKSEFFKIQRGCKQSDPIAAYLFIIGGQILNYLISQNIEIKGLVFDCEEIKLMILLLY